MKQRFNYIAFCLLALQLTIAPLQAQDYKAQVKDLVQKFSSLNQLMLDVKVQVYENELSTVSASVYNAKLKKNGNNFYSEAGNIRMLMNDRYLLVISKDDKRIICSKRDKKSEQKFFKQNDWTKQLDSLIARNDSVVFKGTSVNRKRYIIYNKSALIQRAEISFDAKTGYLAEIIYHYNPQQIPSGNKVRVDYTVNDHPTFSDQDFSEKRFIQSSKNTFVAGPACPGYSVVELEEGTIK